MSWEGDVVFLWFGDVWAGADKRCIVQVIMGGVRQVTCDDVVVRDLEMDQDDGSVIAFRRSANTAELVVTWTSYEPRFDQTKAYTFEFTTFDMFVKDAEETQDPLP